MSNVASKIHIFIKENSGEGGNASSLSKNAMVCSYVTNIGKFLNE